MPEATQGSNVAGHQRRGTAIYNTIRSVLHAFRWVGRFLRQPGPHLQADQRSIEVHLALRPVGEQPLGPCHAEDTLAAFRQGMAHHKDSIGSAMDREGSENRTDGVAPRIIDRRSECIVRRGNLDAKESAAAFVPRVNRVLKTLANRRRNQSGARPTMVKQLIDNVTRKTRSTATSMLVLHRCRTKGGVKGRPNGGPLLDIVDKWRLEGR